MTNRESILEARINAYTLSAKDTLMWMQACRNPERLDAWAELLAELRRWIREDEAELRQIRETGNDRIRAI